MKLYSISFAGAGKTGGALCRQFFTKGHHIVRIASKGGKNGPELAAECNAEWNDILKFDTPCDFVIVSVPDNYLIQVLGKIECGKNTIVAHTAGSYGLEVFPEKIRRRGVFYPLQTFSKGRKIDFSSVPVFLEASHKIVMTELKNLARTITSRIYESDTENRRMLHLAAVFACNFSNHMFTLAKQICSMTPYQFNVMLPLITETVNKAIENGPETSQTGPAIRRDTETVKKHLKLLSFSKGMQEVYQQITDSISEYYKNK
ncbi:MAG: Rossmann-like and DUF2520 domain-containing protein [Bacteroidales bacterium]